MKQRFVALCLIVMMILTACDAGDGQDILIEMEVTSIVTQIVVVTATSEGDTSIAQANTTPAPLTVNTVEPSTDETTTATPAVSPTAGPTATPNVFPTPIVGEILIAEQDFQNGKMFWLQPIDQIWVATTNDAGEQLWINRDDIFEDGMVENDPQLTPPAQGLFQPIRGFGFLWRTEENLQTTLGWATGDEFGHTTNYEYHWGGTVNENNVYEAGPGYHLITTLNRTVYRFDEATRTWSIIRQNE
ncbi:MAG: hypothetical protein WBC91_19080 [Phototrophicaceae bacterium]